jgi:glycosyltransferase involved in cell wall biosynthesis
MLVDNPMLSDKRVEKEIETLNKNFNCIIKVIAMKENNLPKKEMRSNYEILRLIDTKIKRTLKRGYKKYLMTISKRISEFSFDILHCHDYQMLFIGSEIKKLKPNVKLIYDSHEYLRGWPLYLTNRGIKNKIKGYLVWNKEISLEKKSIRNTDKIITVTNSIANSLKEDLNLNQTPTILSNFPELIKFKNNDYLKNKFNIGKEKKLIIHSGSIYYSNNQLKQLFKIINEFEDIILIFIGNRPRFYEIKNKNYSLNNNVFFEDYPKEYDSLFSLLCSADVGLLHVRNKWKAHKMGSANKFIEYSHAGLAVISTFQNTAIEINKRFKHCNFYDENNFNEFKIALNQTLKNLNSLKNNALKTREKINWESESKKLVELYNTII